MTPDLTADNPIDEPTKSAPSTAGMTTKVVKGSIWTLAGQVAPLAVSLFTTPFVIRMLGAEGYGVLILVGLIPTYLGFADFGMSLASTKFASEAYAAGDEEKEGRIVRTAASIAILTSLPFAIAIFAFSSWIVSLLNVPEHVLAEASLALKIASITLVVNFLNSIFNTPQLTRLRMDLNTFVTSGFRILGIIATPIAIYLGFGISGAVTVLLIAALLTLAGHLYTSGRLLPSIFDITIDRSAIPHLTIFGRAIGFAAIAAALLINIEKVVLARVASAETLAYYSVAFTLAFMMTLFSVAMAQSLIPAFSQLQGSENRSFLSNLFSRGVRMNLLWLVPVLAILAVLAKPMFTLWAGQSFGRESVVPFYILLVGVGFHVVATPARAAIMASGRSDIMAKVGWIELFPYVFLVWALTNSFGAAGAAAAWSIRAVGDAMLSFTFAKRISKITIQIPDPVMSGLAVFVMAIPVLVLVYWGDSYLILTVAAAVCVMAYAFITWKYLLKLEEVKWIKNKFTGLGFVR